MLGRIFSAAVCAAAVSLVIVAFGNTDSGPSIRVVLADELQNAAAVPEPVPAVLR